MGQVVQSPASAVTETTNYQYDALDNLVAVKQGSLTRTFGYDEVGRLTNANNPETGNLAYTYDENGNILTAADSRVTKCYGIYSGSTCTSGYDALNRATRKSYSDPNTKPVTYTWDTIRVGSLSSVDNTDSKTTYDSYDGLGRVSQSTQTTSRAPAAPFTNYAYYKNGALKGVTYPTGRVLSFGVDTLGRPNTVTNYVTSASYAPHGGMRQMAVANGSMEQTCYNTRLQVSGMRTGSAFSLNCVDSGDPLNITYRIPASNGGDIQQTTTKRSGTAWVIDFTYDGVGRLATAGEGTIWSQGYTFDGYGNRAVNGTGPIPSWTPSD